MSPGTGVNGPVYTISWPENGKVIIGGNFTIYDGTLRLGLAQIFASNGYNPAINLMLLSD